MNLTKIQLIVVIDSMPAKENMAKQCNKKLVQHVTNASYYHERAKDIVRTSQRDLSNIVQLLHTKVPEEEVKRIVCSIQETQEKLFSAQNAADKAKEQFLLSNAATLEVLGCQGDVSISQWHFHVSGEQKERCLFCSKVYDAVDKRNSHMLQHHAGEPEKVEVQQIVG